MTCWMAENKPLSQMRRIPNITLFLGMPPRPETRTHREIVRNDLDANAHAWRQASCRHMVCLDCFVGVIIDVIVFWLTSPSGWKRHKQKKCAPHLMRTSLRAHFHLQTNAFSFAFAITNTTYNGAFAKCVCVDQLAHKKHNGDVMWLGLGAHVLSCVK